MKIADPAISNTNSAKGDFDFFLRIFGDSKITTILLVYDRDDSEFESV